MKIPELLSPAGSLEGVRAAVQSGASAVYMGFGAFNARRGAQNFTREEMKAAIAYCRARGVATNITFNIVVSDREREAALADARFLQEAGADALIVQDLGLARLLRRHAPALALHASTQMTVNSLDGALFAKKQGFSRVVLARECTLSQIEQITAQAGIETEVFVHGALCMCYSGQCYLSAMLGQRSGNRGLCAQPCRLAYSYGGKKASYPLSLKDLSLAAWLHALRAAGVASLKIEGRMKRPEYAAVVTKIFADLLQEGRKPVEKEWNILQKVFSRDGFTDGYLTGQKDSRMFGTKTEVPLHEVQAIYDEAANRFADGKEAPLVPVHLALTARKGEPVALTASDRVFCALAEAGAPEPARKRATTEAEAMERLQKTGGTPFYAESIRVDLEDGLMLPASMLNGLRRNALEQLLALREAPPIRPWIAQKQAPLPAQQGAFQGYIIEVRALAQATDALLKTEPLTLYAPLEALAGDPSRAAALCARLPVAAVLPRIFSDDEREDIESMLKCVCKAGIKAAVAGNVGHIPLLQRLGLMIYGDFGLNATNSDAFEALTEVGVSRLTASFELRLPQIRDLRKPAETELIVYGYLPLMIFETCAIRRETGKCSCKHGACALTDRTGKRFQLLPEFGCRNTLCNSQPLYLPERRDYTHIGVDYARLRFTTESPMRCAEIARAYQNNVQLEFPEGATRGLYFRGVT